MPPGAPKKDQVRVLRRMAELRALKSPVRQDLVAALEDLGPSSVGDLAARLGRTSHSLYYHVRELERAGLVRAVETRRVGRRDEVVYDLSSAGILIDPEQRSPRFLEALGEMYASTLRRTERELLRALEADGAGRKKEPRRTGLLSVTARLTPRAQARLRHELLELCERIEAEDDPSGEPIRVTLAFHPTGTGQDSGGAG